MTPTAKTETIQKVFGGKPQTHLAEGDSRKPERHLKGSLKKAFFNYF